MQQLIPAQRIEGLINDRRGLDDAEIESRRARYGRNDILEAGRHCNGKDMIERWSGSWPERPSSSPP